MAKQKTKRVSAQPSAGRSQRADKPGWWQRMSPQGRRRFVLTFVHAVLITGLVAGVWFGLVAADRYVQQLDRYQGKVEVVLRVKHQKNDVLLTTRQIKDAGLADKTPIVYKDTDRSNRLLVECKGKTVKLAADDVQPAWLNRFETLNKEFGALRDRVVKLANEPAGQGGSPDWFDQQTISMIARIAGGDPLVEKVVQVERQIVGDASDSKVVRQIVLTVVLRKPVAQVFIAKPGYVLDAKGVVIKQENSLIGLPQVAEFRARPGGAKLLKAGDRLDAPDILAGLELLGKLSNQQFYGDILEVNVENFQSRKNRQDSELSLVVREFRDSQARVWPRDRVGWGMLQDNDAIEYNNTQGKIQILNEIWAQYGRLSLTDIKVPPYDLWHRPGKPFWVQPPSIDTAEPGSPAVVPGSRGTGRHVAAHR